MNEVEESPEPESQPPTPGDIIDGFRRRIRAIKLCATEVIPKAIEVQKDAVTRSNEQIAAGVAELDDQNPRKQAEALSLINRAFSNIDLHRETPHGQLICQSLLRSGFSSFDAFLGHLLRSLYSRNEGLLRAIEKQLGIADLLDIETLQNAKDVLIEKDIESLLRESYPTVFQQLARRFDVGTLTEFPNWPVFVEAAQRRNLITHCDGKVNNQYLAVCKREGVKIPEGVIVGTRLEVNLNYLGNALDVLYEVGFKLGQVLWRKGFKSAHDEADTHLINGVVDILHREEWHIAKQISDFSVKCVKACNEKNKKMMLVNHAQALYWSGDKKAALHSIDQHDWTGNIRDLRLGVAAHGHRIRLACNDW